MIARPLPTSNRSNGGVLMKHLKKVTGLAGLPLLFILFLGVTTALAEVQADRTHPAMYSPSTTVNVTMTVTYTGTLLALGLEDTVPEGWTFVSATGSGSVQTKNDPGDSGKLEFYWITVPASPVTLTYTLQIPGASAGDKVFSGKAIYYETGIGRNSASDRYHHLRQPSPHGYFLESGHPDRGAARRDRGGRP